MTDSAIRQRLIDFLTALFPELGRRDRRHWGEVYVRGLLTAGERKSIEPLAQRLPDGNVQALQQFIGQSPWPYEPVRQRLAHLVLPALGTGVWVVDDTGFPKQGRYSVGVARQYSGTLGKVANCQIAVSIHHVTPTASLPVDWALYLPEEWTDDRARCAAAGVPAEVTFQPKWRLALTLLDGVQRWAVPAQPVVADAGYGNIAAFRDGLTARGFAYVVGIESTTGVWRHAPAVHVPRASGRGRPPTRVQYGAQQPQSVAAVAQRLPRRRWRTVRWREGSKGMLGSRFARVRVQGAHGHTKGKPPGPEVWLLIEWPRGAAQPTKYWLSTLPHTIALRRLVTTAKQRWRVEQDYAQMKEELGLDHYEGRGWLGWHHHVTMVMVAYGFLMRERVRRRPRASKKTSSGPRSPRSAPPPNTSFRRGPGHAPSAANQSLQWIPHNIT
ncbi:MAG: IS701 family transposase [Candidatus Dormiibacterota bacterium]